MEKALGAESSVLRDFNGVRYSAGIWTGAPGEAEVDCSLFADAVDHAAALIDAAVYELRLDTDPPSTDEFPGNPQPRASSESNVFIVHGHDDGAKHEVARFLRRILMREPIILDEQPNSGMAILEKFEKHAGTSSFAVVLLTPDDIGRSIREPQDDDRHRARQNVIFELGYFFGRLGRGRVAVLNAGVEQPSDVAGLVYISYPKSNWQIRLANELQAAGVQINANRLLADS